MVKLHVKRGDESQFLYETTVKASLDDVAKELVKIFNQRLKIERLFYGKYKRARCAARHKPDFVIYVSRGFGVSQQKASQSRSFM